MNIFEYSSYKRFLRDWIQAQPAGGRGMASKIAASMTLSSTMLSQVLNGEKNLNLEHAADLSEFLSLNDKETDFLFLLIEFERAGSQKLQKRLRRKIEAEQKQSAQLANRLQNDRELTPEIQSLFYSSWIYTGIRNLVAVADFNSADVIAEKLRLPKSIIVQALEFLIRDGLVVQQNGVLEPGPRRTHLPSQHHLVNQHHRNWRDQALQAMERRSENDLFFTSPLSCSEEVAAQLRKRLPAYIEEISKLVGPSQSETVRCLNIDLFEY